MTRKEKAMQSFLDGYNCSQSILLAFEDLITIDMKTALQIASPYGGGMGRLREVCGSVSGMFMVLGYMKGYDDPKDYDSKKQLYEHVQELARRFEEKNGSIVCRNLLGLSVQKEAATPSVRTEEYYKKRPCKELIGCAAEILEDYLREINVIKQS
jgi:C_GCAxxG_C_C family probable redox protein